MNQPALDAAAEFVDGLDELPTLGPVALELLRALDSNASSTRKILSLLAQDPLLAAKVVRLANSSFYGGLGAAHLDQALVRLGLREVRNVILASSVVKTFPDLGPGFDLRSYWSHCIASGLAAHRVAQKAPALLEAGEDTEGFYMMGLLHHLGICLHALFRAEGLRTALELGAGKGMPLYLAEREVLGFDHAESATRLLERWAFPETVCAAVRHHHEPERAPERHRSASRVLHVAAMLCHSLQGEAASFEGRVAGFDEAAWFGLGFEAEALDAMQDEARQAVSTAEGLVQTLFP